MRTPLLVLMLLALTACSGSKSAQKAESTAPLSQQYFPLKVGDRWIYEDTYLGKTQNFQVVVSRQDGPSRFVAQMAPTTPDFKGKPDEARFELRPRGIFDGSRYILEEPMKVGHKWMAIQDVKTAEKFELMALDAAAEVPAGKFAGCARTESVVKLPAGESTITEVTFCKEVGMVERLVWVTHPGRERVKQFHLKLLSYESGGKRIYPKQLGD